MHKLDAVFYTTKLNFIDGIHLVIPVMETDVFRVNQSTSMLAGAFAERFQNKVINKGNFRSYLDYFQDIPIQIEEISLKFPASKNRYTHPEFSLSFSYLIRELNEGFWAQVPVLGVEAFGKTVEDLQITLEESIRMDFARNKRLKDLSSVISVIWMDNLEVESSREQLTFYNPGELEKLSQTQQEQLLPKVATFVYPIEQVCYGRKEELLQATRILKGRFNRNLLLLGPSGVGKTALVWEIARQRKTLGITPQIWETTASRMIKELTLETGWQDNLSHLCRELRSKGDLLFVRNFLELFEVGQYEGNSVSMADYLREFVNRGEVNIITECTNEEFARIEARSPNFISLFQQLRLEEPKEDLKQIILDKITRKAKRENVEIEKQAIEEAIRLNKRYTPYSGFPGKPLRFLESLLLNRKTTYTKNRKKKKEKEDDYRVNVNDKGIIRRTDIVKSFCEETGMPEFIVDPEIRMNLGGITDFFSSNVFGQQKAIDCLTDLMASVKTAVLRQGKPIASMLFVGPTGVGKTEMAKVLAEFMFGSREKMIRFDMSEFSNPYSVQRLTGLNYYEDGLLTGAVRREPFCVLLFDELEKAHPLFYDLLLQMLGEGRLTDSQGKLVNFCSTIIIMTSNIGAGSLDNRKLGWKSDLDVTQVNSHFEQAVRRHFRPELFNRIDQVIPFEPLQKDTIRMVVDREMSIFKKREGIQYRNLDLKLKDEIFDLLGEKGYDPKYGARKLQRIIREELLIPLSETLNSCNYDDHLIVTIGAKNNKIDIDVEVDPLKIELLLEELSRIEYGDYASSLRRSIWKLMDGRLYIKLLSELDIMEGQKRRLREKFWQQQKSAERYGYYLECKSSVEAMKAEIELLEQELSLVCMDLATYNEAIIDRLKSWDLNYFNLKLNLFLRLTPQARSCHFALYGSNLERMIRFYHKLFEEKEFEYEAVTVWFREQEYNTIIEIPANTIVEPGQEAEMIKVKAKRYVKQPFSYLNEKSLKPEEPDDKLIGIEFIVKGACPELYLKEEIGYHVWKISEKTLDKYLVRVESKAIETPKDIHRKQFWSRMTRPRRIYEEQYLEDNDYDIAKRQVLKNEHLRFVVQAMDRLFSNKLDEAMF